MFELFCQICSKSLLLSTVSRLCLVAFTFQPFSFVLVSSLEVVLVLFPMVFSHEFLVRSLFSFSWRSAFAARADPSAVCDTSITLLWLSSAWINEIVSSRYDEFSLPRIWIRTRSYSAFKLAKNHTPIFFNETLQNCSILRALHLNYSVMVQILPQILQNVRIFYDRFVSSLTLITYI